MGQICQVIGCPGKQDGGHFAGTPADGQNCSGKNSGDGTGQNHFTDGLPFGGAQGQAGFPHFPGNRTDGFFHGYNHNGQGEQCHGKTGPQNIGLSPVQISVVKQLSIEPENLIKKPRPNSPKMMEGTTASVLTAKRMVLASNGFFRSIFGQVNGCDGSKRNSRNGHDQGHQGSADNGRKYTAFGHSFSGKLGQKFPGKMSSIRR